MTARTIARTAAHLAALALGHDPSASHQCFRIKNLLPEEVVEFVAAWPPIAAAAGLSRVRLIVADDLEGRVSLQHVAEPGLSITHYRNNNVDGLVYLETGTQSDEQGLQNMFSLRDSNLLDRSFDRYVAARSGTTGLLIAQAWMEVGAAGSPPELLVERLREVIELVHPGLETVPVRRFAAFAELACRSWADSTSAVDVATANLLVGDALWALDMFPDAQWRDGSAIARTRRRLEVNLRHADLVDGTSELDAAAIEQRAAATRFVDRDGTPLPEARAEGYRAQCVLYGRTLDPLVRREIPYHVFSQLFRKDTGGLRLGDKVRVEIAETSPDRLPELDALDVTGGLNIRSSHDAAKLLESAPSEGLRPLADLLPAATRRSVERLAVPARRQFFNPSIQLVRLAQRIRAEAPESPLAAIELTLGEDAVVGSPSHGLFVFLFGRTLRTISEQLSGVPGACEVRIAGELLAPVLPPALAAELDDDGEEVAEVSWDPLPLRFRILDNDGQIIEVVDHLEWHSPAIGHLALFWLLVAAPDSRYFGAAGLLQAALPVEGGDWLAPVIGRDVPLDVLRADRTRLARGSDPLLDELIELRGELQDVLRTGGLDPYGISQFLDGWEQLLERARDTFVPDGMRSAPLEAFLGCDMLSIEGSESRLMLAPHPIRLRWIRGYLEETRRLAESFMSGGTEFADGEGELYLDWLESLTPSESPPVAVGHNGQLLYTRSEVGWSEEFAALEAQSGGLGFDVLAIDAIARRIAGYLETHPYKRDGLTLLIVLPPSDAMPAELLRRLARYAGSRSLRMSLHVAAPRPRWDAIARNLEKVTLDGDSGSGTRLFPDRDLSLIEFTAGGDLSESIAQLDLDIAVVSHILQEQILSQQNTEPPVERPGSYDPLRHRPLRLETGGDGGSISLVMLPRYPDRVLESWSTLAVRANRSRAVAPSQPENTDFVELRVNFQDSARLFRDLHARCHWVITLERHISREQIESVEGGSPDVLSIETGVGMNRLSTLVVSSASGRDLVQSRIERKLGRLIPVSQRAALDGGLMTALVAGIYDSTRQLAPRLALQALGVARVTEEIVGLTVARRLAEQHFPESLDEGISAWISLDDHAEWFGGHGRVRADMCRITIGRDSGGALVSDVLVLEGKLRQLYDGHGVLQVRRTCEFFRSVLGVRDGSPPIDAVMWRELVAAAIDNLPEEAVTCLSAGPLPGVEGQVPIDLRASLVSDLRAGAVRLRNVDGVYSACLWESDDPEIARREEDGVTVLRSTRTHLLMLVTTAAVAERMQAAAGQTEVPASRPSVGTAEDERTLSTARDEASGEQFVETELSRAAESTDAPPGREVDAAGPATPVRAAERPADRLATASRVATANERERPGLPAAELRRLYEQVLGCFGVHGVTVSAAAAQDQPFVEGPASILFKVRPGPGIDPRKLAEKGAALKLVLELEQDQNVSFNIDRGFVTIDVPKQPGQRYFVDAADTWRRWTRPLASLAVPIGEDRFGGVVELDFSSSNSPHLLVAGTTGSGKSEALNTILFGLVRHYASTELRLMLVDPKGTELAPFEGSPYLEGPIGWDDQDAIGLLHRAVEEMQRRYLMFRGASRRSLVEYNSAVPADQRLPWWLIVLDEYADLTHDPQAKKDIEAELKRLAQKARAAGIHVIIATQKPSAEVISTNLRSNLPAQLALRVKSATESRVVIDEAGAENLNGKGDSLLKAEGRLTRVQCSRVAPEDQRAEGID